MGWERKRGKLLEFNRLLRGARDTSYAVMSADPASLPRIRFVITLDADTQMPRDAAGRLVGTLAHPLNRPRFDPAGGRVVAGYGVLQPRISFHLTAATRSRFAALLATSGGIDPYSTAASDAYMDLFGVGSFTGKGIYDVDAFEAATGETFPENHILSHDLIEGNYARCGLVSDTELFDDFPARYHAYARREHRWVRGDWQLLPWLGRARADARAGRRRQPAAAAGALEALRQPPPQPGAAGARGAAGPGLDGPAGLALALDGGRRWRLWRCPLFQSLLGERGRQRPRPVAVAALKLAARHCRARARPGRAGHRRSWPIGRVLLLDAIVRTLVRLFVDAAQAAGVGDGRVDGAPAAGRACCTSSRTCGRRRRWRSRSACWSSWCGPAALPAAVAVPGRLAPLAGRGLPGQPAPAVGRDRR